jgi:hypothetical protein
VTVLEEGQHTTWRKDSTRLGGRTAHVLEEGQHTTWRKDSTLSVPAKISVCAPSKRARRGPSVPLSVLLLSGAGHF